MPIPLYIIFKSFFGPQKKVINIPSLIIAHEFFYTFFFIFNFNIQSLPLIKVHYIFINFKLGFSEMNVSYIFL